MPFFVHDDLRFRYHRGGQGIPFIFQHGLGGDLFQPTGVFTPPPGVELLSFDFRAHGETRPLGRPEKIGFSAFADDLNAFMDQMGLERAVVGGISMGAGVALNFALRFPGRVLGLVLSRPAWLDGPMAESAAMFAEVSRLIAQYGARQGAELFKQSNIYRAVLRESPDVAASLVKQFENPRAEDALARLSAMPNDAPSHDRREWQAVRVPTLVLANRQDPIHPFEYGKTIAQGIHGAEFEELTAKSVSAERHAQDTQRFIERFLQRFIVQA